MKLPKLSENSFYHCNISVDYWQMSQDAEAIGRSKPCLAAALNANRVPLSPTWRHAKQGQATCYRHAPKDGVGWLMNDIEGKVCRFKNDMPSAHAEWVKVETRLIRGGGQPVVRRLLRHNAIEAWETMQESGGWKRCPPKW